jgi:hypothetical protein
MPNPATSTSPTSKVLHRLGCFFIGTPASLSMPRDFYREKGDRDMPTAKEIMEHKVQRDRVAVNTYRLQMTPLVARYTSIAAFVVCLAGYASLGTVSALHSSYVQHAAQAKQLEQQCEYIKNNHITPVPNECQ